LLGGCAPDTPSTDAASAAPVRVTMWVHAGPGPEVAAFTAAVAAFEARHPDIRVDLQRLPEGTYGDQVNAAAIARKLPCLLDFDGPNVTNYAWTQRLRPLDGFAELEAIRADLLPSIERQGLFDGKLYSMGPFDSGLALWGNRRLLAQVGARIPVGVDDAWTRAEFEDLLGRLKAAGVPVPLDMKFNYGVGEWFSYGFAPLLQSFGGDLIDRTTMRQASGTLDGAASVQAMQMLQGWVRRGWVNPAVKDDGDFAKGRAALSWVGHWVWRDAQRALGDDLLLLPMPRLGARAATGAGSWNFGISANCRHPQQAARLLAHLMSADEILRVTAANGAVPATRSALARSPAYGPQGPLRLYVEQIERGVAVVRPQTPAYPVISGAFAEAVNNIVAGADVQRELTRAARRIDQEIADNRGYPVR
jgi:multiple sugar transport system substrate-binding protein